jgi:hypothetical protein
MNDEGKRLIKLLRSKPDLSIGFKPMSEWGEVTLDDYEKDAITIFENKQNVPDIENIKNFNTNAHAISYLRYDLKKILIRTRQFYLDNFLNSENKINVPFVGCGFFEYSLICFSFADTMGTFIFENHELRNILKSLGQGYETYSSELESLYRNGVTHQLRPHGNFFVDLNTEQEYLSPYITHGDILKLNVNHFLDSLVVRLEALINDLKNKEEALTNFCNGLKKIKKEHSSVKECIKQTRKS